MVSVPWDAKAALTAAVGPATVSATANRTPAARGSQERAGCLDSVGMPRTCGPRVTDAGRAGNRQAKYSLTPPAPRPPRRGGASSPYSGWPMLTSQGTPNPSTHMPNSSPQTCFCSGIIVLPLADSFSQ